MLKELTDEQKVTMLASMSGNVRVELNRIKEHPVGWISFFRFEPSTHENPVIGSHSLNSELQTKYSPWYEDIYHYYKLQAVPKGMDRSTHAAFKRKVENFCLDEATEKLLHKMGD